MGSSIESRQRLEHAEQTVGGRELQVFLRDIANETRLIASLETNKDQGTKTTLKHAWQEKYEHQDTMLGCETKQDNTELIMNA